MEALSGMVLGLDPKVLWISACIVGVLGLLALLKKAIKAGILIIVIALVITYGGSVVQGIQEKYNLDVDGSIVSMEIDGKKMSLDIADINSCKVISQTEDKVKLEIQSGSSATLTVDIPKVMFNVLKPMIKDKVVELVPSAA